MLQKKIGKHHDHLLPSPRRGVFINGSKAEVAKNKRWIAMAVRSWRAKKDVFWLDVPMDDWLPPTHSKVSMASLRQIHRL